MSNNKNKQITEAEFNLMVIIDNAITNGEKKAFDKYGICLN